MRYLLVVPIFIGKVFSAGIVAYCIQFPYYFIFVNMNKSADERNVYSYENSDLCVDAIALRSFDKRMQQRA